MYDYLIVGAGLFGSVFAYEAKKQKKSVLIIDKRDHIGGNCYTKNLHDIDVHVYGPHVFHTSDKTIWNYINQFSEFNNYSHRVKVYSDNQLYSFPINLFTLYQLWGTKTPFEAKQKLNEVIIHKENPRNLEEWVLSQVGKEIYEKFIYGYTKKQWKKDPKDLPASIIKRLPIRLTHDDNYYFDTYQGIPVEGYTAIVEKMIEGCDLALEEDFFAKRDNYTRIANRIVYTGKIDQFFDYAYGELEYRTLQFDNVIQRGDFQGNSIINYADENIPWTRITEHKHFQTHKPNNSMTIWTKETPIEWRKDAVPYYPISDQKNLKILDHYNQLKEKETNVIFGGRLGSYRYYDMHQVIASALHLSKKEFGEK